jgi:hypothetical protein
MPKRSANEMYGETGPGDDEETSGSGAESAMSGLLMANKLLYHMPHDYTVIVNSTKKESLFAQRQYRDGETMSCTIMTGADFVDPLRSYISFDVDAKLKGFGKWWEHSRVGFGANNTACNFIRSIVVKSRSGDELMRTNNFNVLAAHRMLYVYNEGWWKTVGSTLSRTMDTACDKQTLAALGRLCNDSTWRDELLDRADDDDLTALNTRTTSKTWVTGTHRVNIPLYCLGGIFATDKLLPANLMSGLVVQITLADAKDVFVWHAPKPTRSTIQDIDIAKTIPTEAKEWHQAEEDILSIGLKVDDAPVSRFFILAPEQKQTTEGKEDHNLRDTHQIGFGIPGLINDDDKRCTNIDQCLSVGDILLFRDPADEIELCCEITGFGSDDTAPVTVSNTAYTGCAIVKNVSANLAGLPDTNVGESPITARGGTPDQITVIRRRKLNLASKTADGYYSELASTGGSTCETRQMKDAMNRTELIATHSWGFDAAGKPLKPAAWGDSAVKTNALTNVFSGGNASFETQYNVYVPRVICMCNQLTDAAQRAVNATSAHNGLEIVYYDFENTQAPAEKDEVHVEVKKAVSRAMKAIAVIRPTDTSGTNASTAIKVHTNTFACQPWNVKDYQWQLGALYFPHQRIEGKGSEGDGLAYTASMAYYEALDAFSGFAPKRNYCNVDFDEFTGLAVDNSSKRSLGTTQLFLPQPASGLPLAADGASRQVTHQDPCYRGHGIIAQTLERSGIFELSGYPINNSRVLVLHAAFDSANTEDTANQTRNIDIFLKYVKIARVFMQMVEVES